MIIMLDEIVEKTKEIIGDKGTVFVTKAQNSVDKYKSAASNEQSMLSRIESEIDKYNGTSITSVITS